MKRRALLGMFVVLLVVGAYAAYALSQPKPPEVKGCVNPFKAVKPVEKTPENWSRIHVFFKAVLSKDIRGLAKPWEIDYKNVKIAKHIVEYNGEKMEMLAMGIPLKDKKHIVFYYEFSKPVQGVKTRGFLFEVNRSELKNLAIVTNGKVTTTSTCTDECQSDLDCGLLELCNEYCCSMDNLCLSDICAQCIVPCSVVWKWPEGTIACLACIGAYCGIYAYWRCCEQTAHYCEPMNGP